MWSVKKKSIIAVFLVLIIFAYSVYYYRSQNKPLVFSGNQDRVEIDSQQLKIKKSIFLTENKEGQGIANDQNFLYVSDTRVIKKYNFSGKYLSSSENFNFHFGGMCIANDKIYIVVDDKGSANDYIYQFNKDLIKEKEYDISNIMNGEAPSDILCKGDFFYIAVSDYSGFRAGRIIKTNKEFSALETIDLEQSFYYGIQGIEYHPNQKEFLVTSHGPYLFVYDENFDEKSKKKIITPFNLQDISYYNENTTIYLDRDKQMAHFVDNSFDQKPTLSSLSEKQYSISAWFLSNGGEGNRRTIVEASPNWNFSLELSPEGYLMYSVLTDKKNFSQITENKPEQNIWHHVVLRYKTDEQISVFLDGQELSKHNLKPEGNLSPFNKIQIGSDRFGLNRWFVGKIKDVAIYNEILTPEQIKTEYFQQSIIKENLIGYWPLNNRKANIARDLSSQDNHGKIFGATNE